MIDEMEVVDPCIVRLRDGRSMDYSEYGAADGYPIVNAHVGRACRLDGSRRRCSSGLPVWLKLLK
jgi:hypothetical protein